MLVFRVAWKNLVSSLRGEYVDFIISRVAFTLLSVGTAAVLFGLNGGRTGAAFGLAPGRYLGWITVGAALYGTTRGILLNVSRTLMTERREGTLEAVLIAPFPRWQYYGGNQLHQLMLTGMDIAIAAGLSLPLGIEYRFSLLPLIGGTILLFATLYGLALLTSLAMILLKDTFFIQNTLLPLLLILGGYLFPLNVLPPFLRLPGEWLPLQLGVELLRHGCLGAEAAVSAPLYALALLKSVAFLAAGFLLLPFVERRALEDYLS